MRRAATLPVAALITVVILTGCGSGAPSRSDDPTVAPAHSMKGYELYSWESGGEWHFSLLVGTNRLKSLEEIMSETASIKGVDGIITELERLPEGEEVFWQQREVTGLSPPPGEVVDRVRESCESSGVRLFIAVEHDTG